MTSLTTSQCREREAESCERECRAPLLFPTGKEEGRVEWEGKVWGSGLQARTAGGGAVTPLDCIALSKLSVDSIRCQDSDTY